jgi:hypothetical protein
MKKFLISALVAGALAIPSVTLAQGAPLPDSIIPGNSAGFESRGKCESALARQRNTDRKNQDALSNKEYNRQTRDNVSCVESDDGMFRVVFD